MAIKITKNGTAGAQDRAPAAKTYQEGSSQGKASGRIKITKIERPQTTAKQKWTVGNIGQYGAGNIDLYDRPQYRNANGSISTVDSTSYNIDGQEVLLPTVWNRNGTPYHSSNDEEILQRYRDTGEYLGKFSTVEEANDYAEKLHLEQQERYPSSSLPAERGSKHKSGKEISQSIVRNEDAAKRIGATVRATAQNLGANASGFLAALVAAAEEMDKEYRDAKEKAGVTTHADEMNPYPKTNEEITRGNRAGIDLLEGIADTQRAKAAQNIRTAKEGLGTAGKVGIDAFQIGMNLAGIVGANAILPGLGTAALGVSSGGAMANDYRQAQGENYNPLAGAGLAIGGAASVGVGGAAAKGAIRYGGALLNKLGLGNSAIAQNVLGALSDIAFAGGMSATNEYAKAAAYGDSYEDVAISGEELAKDMLFQAAVGFFCRTLASSLGGKAEGATAQKAQREYFKDIDNLDDLTKAFKQYGRQYHPDRFATADAATQREMNDLFAKISAEYNAVKAELAVETAGRAAKAYSEQRTAKTPEAAQKAQAAVKDEIAVMRSLVESGAIQAKEAVEAVQILDALAGEQTAGKPENPTADTAPEQAADTSGNAPMPTSEEIGNQQAAQNSSPAQGADHSRQRVGGTVAPLGVSATQESKVSITPVGGKSKSDPLTQGKRVSLLQYANEGNAAEISERLNRGELAVDANGDLYRPKAEEHIDQRDSNTVGERRIKAFQFDHPEVHSFYKEAAANLMEELNYAEKGGGIVKLKEHGAGDDQYIRMKRSASERIAKLLDDEDISYADIERSISAIINDKGQENFAAAKRVELMLDNMLSNGYRDVHGGYHEPNADYLEAKQSIPGASETAATHEELPLWDIEEKNGGATHGTEIKPAEPAEEGGADAVGAQSDLHGGDGGRRPYGDGAGGAAQLRQQPKSGSIERLHENVRRNRARTGSERSKENGALIQARQDAAALEPLVSSAEVGVSLGTDTKMLHILPRNAWDQELLDVEAAAKQAGISEVVMVTGLLQVNGGGSPVSITGVAERETNRIVMRVDSRKKTASELGLHEIAHFRSTRENVEAFAAAVQDSGDGWRDTLEEYRERYKGAANNYEGMTPEDADLYVWEEIMGDAYAGIDCFGQTASQYHTEAVRAIDGRSGAIPAQEAQRASSAIQKETSAASERKTGPPARFSYAGRNANGANLESLREAQEMQAAGADMESIRKATGWHEGMDGKWRWEIDDSKMEYHRAGDALFGRNHPEYAEQQRLEQKMLYGELTDTEQARLRALTETWGRERSRLSERVERGNARLEDVLDHEELFRAYPQLRHVRVVFDETPKGVLGSFSAEGNQITISEELRDAPQDVLIHEIQHAIQNAEGFAKGSNRQYWEEKLTNGDEIQSKGFQEAREKLIQFQLDEANEEVLALRDQLEKAGELDDGFREYDRIWEEAERRGLDKKINEYYDLRENYYDQLHKPQRSVPSELYYNTAGEIEARDAANRRPMSSETRNRIKPDYGNGDTVFANGEDSYSVGETDDGRAVAVVDNDILSHIDTSTWDSAKKAQAKAAAKTALLAFEDGIQVNGITYKVNRTSRREYTRSEDTERLARRTPDAFADKMRAADIADDIITATTSWAKDGKLKHPRRDSFVDFAHGDVLIQAGANQYDAETVVGITADGEYVFYDVVDMTPTSFTTKKEPSPTAAGDNASSDIQESSSERSISRSTEKSNREISGVQPLSLPTLEPTTKTRFSLDEPVEETETLVAMHNMTEEKLRRTLDIGAWPSPSIAVVKAKEGHANYGEYSAIFPRGTIDPQADSRNKVYGGDAWTPTHDNAIVERGVNYEARRAFDDRIKDLSSQFAGGVFQGSGTLGKIGLENDTRWEPEEIADKLANHPEVQAAFRKEGYAISDGHAKSILALIGHAANIPTGYYEAKPQRVVGFDEALAVVAPDNAPADLLGEMRNAGMNVVEYKAGDEADRLAKVNSVEKARFSVDEDGGILPDDERDKWENTRLTPEQKEQLERARARARGDAPRMQDFDNVDDYFAAMRQRAEAERKKRMRNVPKEEFEGTEALQDLGIKIENSAGLYQNVEQMIENDKAAKKIQREIRRAEKRLSVTPKEKSYAAGIAAGIYDADDIPSRMNASKVMELADYYTAEQAMKSDTIPMQRQDISQNLRAQAAELFKDTGNDTFEKKYEKALFSPKGGLALYHRTPQRSMRAIFGWEQGQKINEAIFEPVYVNEQERKRFVNRMHDEVRRFEDKNGKQTALTEKERALTQLVIEGKAVAELVAASDMKEQLIHAAENLKAGGEMADVSQEFGLHDKEARDLARRYADWLQTQEDLAGTDVDQTKVEHAVEAYRTLYDKFYKAINHFLVAHGYEPIGFIKGYAPHFQPEAESGKLEKALKSIGVDLGAEAGSLPASIAGLTKAFKPNKRYNPFFQHRAGKSTEYDVEKGFEKYVDYLSDVLYHTDDIMRVRAAVKYFREEYGPDEISAEISRAESLRFAPKEAKESFLKSAGLLTNTSDLSYADLSAKMEEYVEGLFDSIKKTSKYSDLTVWLDDYANKLAGKQLFSDRDMEREVGRTSLNVGRKLNKMFARANVAGNLSSSLNQTAQLPMIAGEIGPKYVIKAVNDIIAGKTKGDFADQSDFLTEKNGIDYLTNDKGSKITSALFWPLERMDYLISSIAVRGKYRKELDAGRSPKEAMKAADRWARDIMGTRSKGAAPLTFQSKNLIAQIVNMFQVEALNSWEHVTQDLFGPGLKEAEAKLGKEEAAKRLAGIIVATLLGAFLLNRVAEEGYGGTPAQFDVIGLLVGFLASGNGLSTNEQIATWIDDAWESGTGERLFGTDANAGNDKFDAGAATEDTLYNVSNDIPYLRNAAGLLGLGDQTLPMPDIYGTVTGTAKAVKDNGPFSEEVMRQLMGLAGDTLPGGRQAEKTYQGIETLLKGGYYKGSGEDERLQYPVSDDFWNVVQATMFGRNALSETRDFYAAGGKGLSAAQTRLYKQLVDMGADSETVYDAILAWKKIDGNDALSKAERETARFELVQSLPLTSEERELLHNTLSGSDTKYSAADEAKAQGIPVGTYQKFQADAAALESDRDKDGNVIRNSKKEKVLKLIDSLPLNKAQKDWLYLNEGYAESKLDETPWQ